MPFSEACLPSGRGRRVRRPYGRGDVCLYWDLTAAKRAMCLALRRGEGWSYSAHILMRCQGKLPTLTASLTVIACAQRERGWEYSKEGWGHIKTEASVMGWVDKESSGVEGGWDEEAEKKKNMRKIQSWVFDLRSNLNSNFRLQNLHCCYNPPDPTKVPKLWTAQACISRSLNMCRIFIKDRLTTTTTHNTVSKVGLPIRNAASTCGKTSIAILSARWLWGYFPGTSK